MAERASMDILGQSALIVAVTAFALAVTALSRNLRNKVVMAYAVLCSVISGWAFFFFLEKVFATGTFYRVHLGFNLLVAPAGLLFVRVLTRVETTFLKALNVVALVYAVLVMALGWTMFGETQLVKNLAFFAPSFLVLVCLHLMWIDWRLKQGEHRKTKMPTVGFTRRSWIYLGGLALLGTAAMDHVPWLGDVVPSVGNILLCLYLFVVSEAIIHQRLLNISALLNRVLGLVFISFCLTLIYTVFVAWIDQSPALFILNTFLASFIIILLVDPMKKLANLGLMHAFSMKYLAFAGRVEDAQHQLVGVLDTAGLAQLTLSFVENTLKAESATVFVLRSDGAKFRRIRGFRDEMLANREILVNHPMFEFLARMRRKSETPVLLDHYLENEIDRTTSQAQRQSYDLVLKGIQGLSANLVIPFLDGNIILGFVAIKATTPPEPWGNNWGVLSVAYPFFEQAARALKNTDVYVRLREKDRLAALGEMAAGLAHEIRNPLGAIKGAAQYLEPQKGGPQAEFLRVIVEEVNRLNKVVTQFLDYSRPWSAEMLEYDIGSILERTVALFSSPGGLQSSAKLELVRPSEGFSKLPRVRCAPEQIKQVLVNLIQNSMSSIEREKPMEGGLVRIGAYTAMESSLVVFVEDNGAGIPRENMEKIFIPFFTTSPGGTGLGLPICARIIESHGGTIEVTSDIDSQKRKTTRFSMHLLVKK